MVLLGAGACTIAVSATYFKGTFALAWAVTERGFDRRFFPSIVTIALVVQLIFQPFGAVIASKVDLKRAAVVLLVPELIAMPVMFLRHRELRTIGNRHGARNNSALDVLRRAGGHPRGVIPAASPLHR